MAQKAKKALLESGRYNDSLPFEKNMDHASNSHLKQFAQEKGLNSIDDLLMSAALHSIYHTTNYAFNRDYEDPKRDGNRKSSDPHHIPNIKNQIPVLGAGFYHYKDGENDHVVHPGSGIIIAKTPEGYVGGFMNSDTLDETRNKWVDHMMNLYQNGTTNLEHAGTGEVLPVQLSNKDFLHKIAVPIMNAPHIKSEITPVSDAIMGMDFSGTQQKSSSTKSSSSGAPKVGGGSLLERMLAMKNLKSGASTQTPPKPEPQKPPTPEPIKPPVVEPQKPPVVESQKPPVVEPVVKPPAPEPVVQAQPEPQKPPVAEPPKVGQQVPSVQPKQEGTVDPKQSILDNLRKQFKLK